MKGKRIQEYFFSILKIDYAKYVYLSLYAVGSLRNTCFFT